MRTMAMHDIPGLVGQEIGVTDWVEITQAQVNGFADATGDHQWIHVDVERATRELGSPIAHGFLTLSLLPMLTAQTLRIEGVSRGINYGLNKVRFTNVVPIGSRVRLRERLLSAEAKSGGLQIVRECAIEIEGQERPALIAEWITVIYS